MDFQSNYSNSVFTGHEDSAHTADEADERGLWKVPNLEEQEGQRGASAQGEGLCVFLITNIQVEILFNQIF